MSERISYQLPRYTREQLASIVRELKAITIDDVSVFSVTIINAATDKPIDIDQIRSSGMIYLRVQSWVSVGNFAAWVKVDEK